MTSLQQTAMLGGAASAKTASYTLVAADAGTAISMSNASPTTITVNTSLFAAGDTVQITNLGAGVCTITAGTATVNTSASLALAQYESGTLNFTSTSAAIFIKGAAGAAASGGMTLLDTLTLSGSSTTSTTFSSAYKQLIIYAKLAHVTSGSNNFELRLNADTGSNYAFSSNRAEGVTNQVIRSTSATAIGFGVIGASATPLNSNFAIINIMQPDQNDVVYIQATNIASDASNQYSQRTSGIYDSSAVITSVTLLAGGSTFNGGTVYIYGVN